MASRTRPQQQHVARTFLLASILACATSAEFFFSATSPVIEDGFVKRPATTCPVVQDGYTSGHFPWTHNPTCVDLTLPHADEEGVMEEKTICAFTNSNYNNGRGISLVVTPDVGMSITSETFGMAIGGLSDEVGEELGMWGVRPTEEKGNGLFVKKDVGSIFAGETVVAKTPALLVYKQLLGAPLNAEAKAVLQVALDQLPEKTRRKVAGLARSHDGGVDDMVWTNGISVPWPWANDNPRLLAITPEIASINHACRPNTFWRFNDYTLAYQVYALKDIKPGEEITMSYGYERRHYGRRIKSLQANYGFVCQCDLCSANESVIEESNIRLSEIKAMKSILPTKREDMPQLLGLLPSLIALLEAEDLISDLPEYEEILAYTWSTFGYADRAKHWAGRAKEHWRVLLTRDSFEYKRCWEFEENVKKHASWKSWKGGDPFEGVGKGHPWDDHVDGHDHDHDHDHDHSHDESHKEEESDEEQFHDQFRGH